MNMEGEAENKAEISETAKKAVEKFYPQTKAWFDKIMAEIEHIKLTLSGSDSNKHG